MSSDSEPKDQKLPTNFTIQLDKSGSRSPEDSETLRSTVNQVNSDFIGRSDQDEGSLPNSSEGKKKKPKSEESPEIADNGSSPSAQTSSGNTLPPITQGSDLGKTFDEATNLAFSHSENNAEKKKKKKTKSEESPEIADNGSSPSSQTSSTNTLPPITQVSDFSKTFSEATNLAFSHSEKNAETKKKKKETKSEESPEIADNGSSPFSQTSSANTLPPITQVSDFSKTFSEATNLAFSHSEKNAETKKKKKETKSEESPEIADNGSSPSSQTSSANTLPPITQGSDLGKTLDEATNSAFSHSENNAKTKNPNYKQVTAANQNFDSPSTTNKKQDAHQNIWENQRNEDSMDNIREKKESPSLEEFKLISFRVHLPTNMPSHWKPVVLGSIPELGEWKIPKVKLYKWSSNASYWSSDPVKIPMSSFTSTLRIHYKYGIWNPSPTISERIPFKRWPNDTLFEGYTAQQNRELKMEEIHYDIWSNNANLWIKNFNEWHFVCDIYQSLDGKNTKDKIMEYQALRKAYPSQITAVTNINFIKDCLLEDEIHDHQKIFLYVLLGYVMEQERKKSLTTYRLHDSFPSVPLLEGLDVIQSGNLPSNTLKLLLPVISALVQQNSSISTEFEWMKAFIAAPEIDPEYKFLKLVQNWKYEGETLRRLKTSLSQIVKPAIDKISSPSLYSKIFKSLISLTTSIDLMTFLWKDILNDKARTDSFLFGQIHVHVGNHFLHLTTADDAIILLNRLEEIPEDVQKFLASKFRSKVMEFLNRSSQKFNWTSQNIQCILVLLDERRLYWTPEDSMQSLDIVSTSEVPDLLEIFPQLLSSFFESSKNLQKISKKAHPICLQWYRQIIGHICSRNDRKKENFNIVFHIFLQLSNIYPVIVKSKTLFNELYQIALERVEIFSDELLFKSTSLIGQKLRAEVSKCFEEILKKRLEFVKYTDKKLMVYIRNICGCSNNESQLIVPNKLCEEILFYIMTRLQAHSPKSGTGIILNVFHVNLLSSSDFWATILMASGSVNRLGAHCHVESVRHAVIQLAEMIEKNTIQISMLQTLIKYSNDQLIRYFEAGRQSSHTIAFNITNKRLQILRDECKIYEQKVKYLNEFYTRFCSGPKLIDAQEYIEDVRQRMKLFDKTTLNEALLPDYWMFHQPILEIAKRSNIYVKSKTFANVFEDCLNQEPEKLSVLKLAQEVLPTTFEQYNKLRSQYANWRMLKCSKALLLWRNVNVNDVKTELQLMTSGMTWRVTKDLEDVVSYLSMIPTWIEQLDQLQITAEIFEVTVTSKSWLLSLSNDLNSEEMLLGQLSEIWRKLKSCFRDVNPDCWLLIKELSISGEFLGFLRSVAEHDIKNLINGVDDHSDERLIQEDTVSSLIEVKQFLLPVMGFAGTSKFDDFVRELNSVFVKNSSLSTKIALCNAHNLALQNMYKNISNRGEVTKERIKNAVTIGTYTFKRPPNEYKCTVSLAYRSKVKVTEYSLSELQDLRGRALLISKSAKSINPMLVEKENGSDLEDENDYMTTFVRHVDMSQQIVALASTLMELGHFAYRDFNESAMNLEEMIDLFEILKIDLEKWKDIVNKSQEDHYYLNFFTARHILTFYDYFMGNATDKSQNQANCEILLRYVHKQAQLPSPMDLQAFDYRSESFDRILSEIGSQLFDIFERLPKRTRKGFAQIELIMTDVVQPGQLFIAACDKTRLANTIMSIFANHGAYPEPWEILICRSSTTAEELSLFIKRCFFASRNGYKEQLFCIANLEVLDYDIQYNLVKDIRTLREIETSYNLALVCCHEPGVHHHIIDQFPDNVHITNGLNASSMTKIYAEICPNVTCVSSALSGQGKTEWIQQASMKNGLIPRSFLISDCVQFERLTCQLKNCNLRKFESLHLNILSVDHSGDVNMFLFELLTLGMISNEVDIAELPDTHVYIEIASTVEQYLLNSLPFTGYLLSHHITWNIENMIVSQELTSPIQVVARYLDAYDRRILDNTNISFHPGPPVSTDRCQTLIRQYFFEENTENILSHRFVQIFVNVFADQLIRMSASSYFRVENLSLMVKARDIRSILVEQFIASGKDFATRGISSKFAQLENTFEADNARLGAILPWEESNHLLVVFLSQAPDSIAAFYRDKAQVPVNVQSLLKGQQADLRICANSKEWALDDYHEMPAEVLLLKLESLARKSVHKLDLPSYALSGDNILKMALILLRARANIPVIVCGEAGCGKTSLLNFLSLVIEVQFKALNLHAGIRDHDILKFMEEATNAAQLGETWLFFDEINTCNHIGLLADLISHRMLNGRLIHHNIRLFAAANPYRLRTKGQTSAGLVVQKRYEERSRLVYQVHPLPDQILDYVWDYGVLQPKDEKKYIQIMVDKFLGPEALKNGFADLLFASQQFIREKEEPNSVSLRDCKRAIKLVDFFQKSFRNRPGPKISKNIFRYYKYPNDRWSILTRSICLALGLCYQARMYDKKDRLIYRQRMCAIFAMNGINMDPEGFLDINKEEQKDYFDRMNTGPSIAANSALLENILVMVVCILTRIPVFIIGAPGSSKSLAIRIISQNLRGTDSDDGYFQKLPQIYVIPHQGSSSSTSDGILKVFEKAHNYQKTSSEEFPLNAVVLLDEVGLAETSPFNPLKVLHSLLEPSYPNDGPKISVIGISNWRLDNSKSSRALLVQRPNFDREDLIETSTRLLEKKEGYVYRFSDYYKRKYGLLADAYLEYEKNQKFSNFHGLRDYYALVKSLSGADLSADSLQVALARNFGGTEQTKDVCEQYFGQVFTSLNNGKPYEYSSIPVEELISTNLDDKEARHLMVIGKSDSIVDILTYQLRQRDLDPVVICGSQFSDDQEDYSYAVLSRIMMCVEAGRPLILTDLEIIYGSLYDLWNQNYITVGSQENLKHYTRVALGAYSNPMCFVHENFRCILIMDEKNLKYADPPLLNRFEKQRVSINDTLEEYQKKFVNYLLDWAHQISTLVELEAKHPNNPFSQKDMFIGFNPVETVQSLVIDHCKKNPTMDEDSIITKCKESLIMIASSDGIIRSEKSALASTNRNEIVFWKEFYFGNRYHDDVLAYFKTFFESTRTDTIPESHQVIINTFSNINTDIKLILEGFISCQIDKLSTFKTEAKLQNRIKRFWLESKDELLILQCDLSTVNSGCIKLAKFLIEQFRGEYLMRLDQQEENQVPSKHACIILHIHRGNEDNSGFFNFMCGWNQVTIETLTPTDKPLSTLLEYNLYDILNSSYPFKEIIEKELLWCLLCNKYPSSPKQIVRVKTLLQKIPNSKLLPILQKRTEEWLLEHRSDDWQLQVASDKKSLYLFSSFSAALQSYIRVYIRQPIAKILCVLERLSALETFFNTSISDGDSEENNLHLFWNEMFLDKKILNIEDLPNPKPDGYAMPNAQHTLRFPFSLHFMNRINHFKKLYQEESERLFEDDENIDDNGQLLNHIIEELQDRFTTNILTALPALRSPLLEHAMDLYYEDFIMVLSSGISGNNNGKLLSYIIRQDLPKESFNPIKLHAYWWDNSGVIIAKLNLAKLCPKIVEMVLVDKSWKGINVKNHNTKGKGILMDSDDEINNDDDYNYDDDDNDDTFERYLIREVTEMMLGYIHDFSLQKGADQTEEVVKIEQWQRQVNNILPVCAKLSESSNVQSLCLLRICNDLVNTKAIPLIEISRMIHFAQQNKYQQIFSIETIDSIMEILDNLEPNESIMTARQSFLTRFLEIIELESPLREHLYEKIFSRNPFPLTASIILRIFLAEEEQQQNLFFGLIESPQEYLRFSPRLNLINECLAKDALDSPMAALCGDIIQKQYFSNNQLCDLVPFFNPAIETLKALNNSEPLQVITSIVFLKEFVHQFWESAESLQDSLAQVVGFNFMEMDNWIEDINNSLRFPNALVHSLKVHFLKDLRSRQFSIENIKKFCEVQQKILPWLGDLPWDNEKNRIKLPVNPYWSLKPYSEAESAFDNLYYILNDGPLDQFLDKLLKNDVGARIALVGLITARLHSTRIATQEFNHGELRVYEFLRNKIKLMKIPIQYRQIIEKIFENQHPFIRFNQQTTNPKMLLISVIIHIVSIHASLPPNYSPLCSYLHQLQASQNSFILTCPSDIEAIIMNALNAGRADGHTRYQCVCGYRYMIGDCGNVVQLGINIVCPECKKSFEPKGYGRPAEGQTKIDTAPVTQGPQRDQPGYIIEAGSLDIYQSVRSMTPASYRILHLFVHAIIGISTPSPTVDAFLQNVPDPAAYCLDHITKDWDVLKNIFDCQDEHLALVIHAILSEMIKGYETNPIAVNTAAEREEWERDFTERYVRPFVKNLNATVIDFRTKLETAATAAKKGNGVFETEIDETIKMDEKYCQNHLPRLWRQIGDTNRENLRAYFSADYQNMTKFPFLAVFFKHEQTLPLIKYIKPIVKFVKILSTRLTLRISRKQAQEMSFRDFINKEAAESEEMSHYLSTTFMEFAEAWNIVIPHVTRFQCHELPALRPIIKDDLPIIFGLIEAKDNSLYLCAILHFLVTLQNKFLQEVINISPGCRSLRFLEQDNTSELGSSASLTQVQAVNNQQQLYLLRSMRVEDTRSSNIIGYEWNNEILKFSQRKLEVGHGQEIDYDLYKIEIELARLLMFDKVYIEPIEENIYLDKFLFHMELFHGSWTLLNEVKALLPQENIPHEKLLVLRNSSISSSSSYTSGYLMVEDSFALENGSELLSSLEILLCFVKRTAIGDGDMLITDYVHQWIQLLIIENDGISRMLQVGLQLKHIVALYELVEDQVADVAVECIESQYKEPLPNELESRLIEILDFETQQLQTRKDYLHSKKKLPAEAFSTALKRFILRYLSAESLRPKEPLSLYLTETSLNCWPSTINYDLVDELFPEFLLIEHCHAAYQLIRLHLQKAAFKRQSSNAAAINIRRTANTSNSAGKKKRNLRGGGYDAM
ncbi:hypothetical protein G9A89_008302 [Geosiphon pyriformis]|nr:hypothetical protein G9A89_008302 [Geosiphon pyriformis]